jgi:hypothetical protein
VLLSGLRRLLIAFAVLVGLTGSLSLVLGALAHANLAHALAVGFYLAGAFVLVGSFVVGLRGPLRAEWGEGQEPEMARELPVVRPGFVPRVIRRTTLTERADSRRNSIALVAVGVLLVLIGAGFDPSRNAF